MKKLSEQAMLNLELGIPHLAQGAFKRAHYQALTTSGKVLRAVNGQLVETYADGTEVVIRNIASPVKTVNGAKFSLKRKAPGVKL
jgi:hypothetical protein